MTRKARNPDSMRAHYTMRGSLMDRCLERLTPLGEIPIERFRREVLKFADSKEQGLALIAELQKRGFIEKTVRVTPLALNRNRCLGERT